MFLGQRRFPYQGLRFWSMLQEGPPHAHTHTHTHGVPKYSPKLSEPLRKHDSMFQFTPANGHVKHHYIYIYTVIIYIYMLCRHLYFTSCLKTLLRRTVTALKSFHRASRTLQRPEAQSVRTDPVGLEAAGQSARRAASHLAFVRQGPFSKV